MKNWVLARRNAAPTAEILDPAHICVQAPLGSLLRDDCDRSAAQRGAPALRGPDRRIPFPPSGKRPRKLLSIVSLAAAAGLLVAAVAAPVVLGAGFVAKSASTISRACRPRFRRRFGRDSTILAADGSVIATLHGAENRVPVKIAQVPKVMQTAIVDIEDSRFYSHHGIDYKGLAARRRRRLQRRSATQGGSTITQQYVKNLLLFSADSESSGSRSHRQIRRPQAEEARLALALEQRESKQQILEGYLNIAYFGHGAYGIGAAAEPLLRHTVNRLTLAQSALLAGLVQSPSADDPIAHPKRPPSSAAVEVLQRMQRARPHHARRKRRSPTPRRSRCIRSPHLPPPTRA